ncbi:MAG: helix-turn-helix domain-containing protein [Nocardioides sp.]|nr:helix-turn-helix domain-containing protein [Nocardioides sp.]
MRRAATHDDLTVWLEREAPRQPNDTIIVERLSLAVRTRHGRGRRELDNRRDLGLLVDESTGPEEQGVAAAALGLGPDARYRVVVAPLFAVWDEHPSGPEDVVPTAFGPLHALVLPGQMSTVGATPCGIGVAAGIGGLHHSFRTAVVALRLCDLPATGQVSADEFGGLASLLADSHGTTPQPDVEHLAEVLGHPWGPTTVDAIVRSGSVRQAARAAGVHHSTMRTRVDTLTEALGFDPLDGFGRTRLGTAHLVWRLRTSRVLDLPPPV